MKSLSSRLGLFVLAVAAVTLCGCAEIQSPPGGPLDTKPPRLLSSEPKSGETLVRGGNRITLRFTEGIQVGTGSQVFISPRLAKTPKVKCHGSELSITLPDTFASNQTYVVQVNATLADLRGNKLDSAVIIAFSTGQVIDSGDIAGVVTQGSNPQSGATVALYALSRATDSIDYDSTAPDYLTMTNQRGAFEFRFLPRRTYRLLAFMDKNKNERYNPRTESYAVPDRPVDVGGTLALDKLNLDLVAVDTAQPQILSASYSQSRMLRVRLSKEIPLGFLKTHRETVCVIDSADTNVRHSLVQFPEEHDSSTTSLTLDMGTLPEGSYLVHVPYDSSKAPLEFKGLIVRKTADKEPPILSWWQPGERPMFASDTKLELMFSEPIDTLKYIPQTTTLIEGEKDTVPVSPAWSNSIDLRLLPKALRAGAKYRLLVQNFGILDLAGNAMADTLRTIKFSVLSADSLGSVSGQVAVTMPGFESSPVVLRLREIKGKFDYRISASGKEFRADVAAGKYVLSGFIDANRDGVHDRGSVLPYRNAEPTAIYPDTVIVRARFETTGIDFQFK